MALINWKTFSELKGVTSENGTYWKRSSLTHTKDGWPAYRFLHTDSEGRTTETVLGCHDLQRAIDRGEYKADWKNK